MKTLKYISVLSILVIFLSCTNKETGKEDGEIGGHHEEENVTLTVPQVAAMDLMMGPLKRMNLNDFVVVNGKIKVPPTEIVSVSSKIGANVAQIQVLEGQNVKKGSVMAQMEHPDLINLQVSFQDLKSQLAYLEQEYLRMKILSSKNVASKRDFQRVEAEYRSIQAKVAGLKAQLKIVGLDPSRIGKGEIKNLVPIMAPIKGVVTKVNVTKGKYVEPQQELFEVVNNQHLHADLRVFEKDYYKVKVGQTVVFTLNGEGSKEYKAKVLSKSSNFDEVTRSVLIQCEIKEVPEELIPGLFIKGRIFTGSSQVLALPDAAVVTEGGRSYAFLQDIVKQEEEDHQLEKALRFKRIEVVKGISDRGFVQVRFLEEVPFNSQFALNVAYYLLAEMKKGEAEHSH